MRRNNDKGPWAASIRETEVLRVDEVLIYVIHDLAQLDLDPAAAGFRMVVSGHSHRPSVEERGGVLYLNPGSAGPRRFKLPIAVADIVVRRGSVQARITELEARAGDRRTDDEVTRRRLGPANLGARPAAADAAATATPGVDSSPHRTVISGSSSGRNLTRTARLRALICFPNCGPPRLVET